MTKYVTGRLLSMGLTLGIVAVLVFMLIHIAAGDPARTLAGEKATEEDVAEIRRQLGLDEPLHSQFAAWAHDLVTGKTVSITSRTPVFELILHRFPVTLSLALGALVVALVIGLPMGIIAALHQGGWQDRLGISIATLGVSVPNFWLAMNLVWLFAVRFRLLPSGTYVPLSSNAGLWLRSLVLPCFTMGFIQAAVIARMTRTSVLEVLNEEYVRTAHAKGLKGHVVVLKHVLRNALIPIVTVIGVVTGVLLGGAVVIEQVFTLPGIGRMLIQGVQVRDYPLIQTTVMFIAALYATVNLLVDLSYSFLDPRIVYE